MESISYKKLFGALLEFLGSDRRKFLIWNIPIMLSNAFSLLQPVLIGSIIDFFTNYSNGQPLNQFYLFVGIFLIGSIIAEAFRLSAKGKMFEISADLEYNIKTKGFDNIQNNALSWQSQENSGNKLQRIETGKDALLNLVDLIKNDLFYIVISFIGILSFFSVINIYLFLFFVVYIILCMLLIRFWNRKNPEMLKNLNNAKERSSGKLFEGLNNILTIKSLGATQSFQSSINDTQNEVRNAVKAWERLGVYKWFSISTLNIVFLSSFFILIAYGVINGIISVGLIFVLYTYFDKLQSITINLNNKLTSLTEIKSKVERMLPVFEVVNFQNGEKAFPKKWDKIQIKNASFEYRTEESKAVFRDINFDVNRGEFVGIIGESGSGKSSLLKLLLGLYPLSSGEYLIGKTNFYSIDHGSFLNNVTVVLQDTELFNISLLENITMFKELDVNLLNQAIQIACLDDVIQSLPEGINTVIGETGMRLSGGQRQRIGIARAIYKNPQIILMDEATSNLDTETERKVVNNILNLAGGKTIIAVAHRLSTLEKATYIYKFESRSLIRQEKLK